VKSAASRVSDHELGAVFAPDPALHDGRYANLGWLQELPRPFTKLTWDNAALMGPKTASARRVATGDMVRISVAGRQVDAPVWVLRGHAEDTVTLPLGYGRREAGRVGNGVGFDAYRIRVDDEALVAVRVEPLGRRHDFAFTQHTLDPSGREPARSVAPGERTGDEEHPTLYPKHESPEHAWAMAIDLDSCIGCNACTIACQAENNIPVVGKQEVAHGRAMHWIRVDRYESPQLEGSIFQPVPCMHCENAPCELVCPVGATMHDSEGLNVQVYNRCIGTRFCSNNCPYKVRRFNFLQYTDRETETLKAQRNPNVTVRRRGVMEKCTYCLQRIARARQHSQVTGTPLKDGDVVTACQAVCPTTAIHFGDLNDPASAVARLRESPRHYSLLGELNTKPRTTYLARVRPKDKA
jgi:Fe-S-cluster-containing dehydrogenase component